MVANGSKRGKTGVSGAISPSSELAAGSDMTSAAVAADSGAFSSGSELAAGSEMTSAAVAMSAGVSGAFSPARSNRPLLLGAHQVLILAVVVLFP